MNQDQTLDERRTDQMPLSELLKPVSAKITPLRCRYSGNMNIPMDDGEMSRAGIAAFAGKKSHKSFTKGRRF